VQKVVDSLVRPRTTPPDEAEGTLHERYFGHEHITVIQPSRGWRGLDLRELWAYRELLVVLTMRDVKVRYKQTVLGAAWAILQPFLTMVVFSILFGRLANMPSDGFPYPIFVYSALLPWTFFSNAVTSSSNSLVGSAHLISKVYFPRLIIPLTAIGVTVVDFVVASSVMLAMMVFYGVGWSVNLLMAPMLIISLVFIAFGVGTILCALMVAYRDIRYIVPFIMQLWMFVTPVVYSAELVPARWRWLLYFNPMTGVIEGFRATFLSKAFNFAAFGLSTFVAILIFLAAVAYFERLERSFADVI
jgi:lipopolysaccharide transport system permease protein